MRLHVLSVIIVVIAEIARCSGDKRDLLTAAINDFCGKISEKLNISDVIFSPFSIYTALVLVESGAVGETKTQMQEVLRYKWLKERFVYYGLRQILLMMNNITSDYALLVANGAFINKDYMIKERYIKNLKKYFDADVKNLNFKDSRSTEVINSWVSNKTNGMIKDMVSELDDSDRIILVNAVYFKGQWVTQFSKAQTQKQPFYNGNKGIDVDMMSIRSNKFLYLHHSNWQYLKLPYVGNNIYMLLALPDDQDAPANFILNHRQLSHITFNMKSTLLALVSIPKFKLEYQQQMMPILDDLGIKDLFSRQRANLKDIREMNDIFVSSMLHQAVIEVDEVGSKAAAATMVFNLARSYRHEREFRANHPFSFYIIDERTNIILFAGTVSNPNSF